ncbi:MAG: hypothetical protein GY849_02520 [Deltaproteobacteria bacterium]|nr:hypothetical protein [Deltaproteobacteria bacterium]
MIKIYIPYWDWLRIDNSKPKVGHKIEYDGKNIEVERIDENGVLYSYGGDWLIGTPYRNYDGIKKIVYITKEQLIKLKKTQTF